MVGRDAARLPPCSDPAAVKDNPTRLGFCENCMGKPIESPSLKIRGNRVIQKPTECHVGAPVEK